MINLQLTEEELEEIRKDRLKLRALEAAGVDNWEGYDYAMEIYKELLEDSEL